MTRFQRAQEITSLSTIPAFSYLLEHLKDQMEEAIDGVCHANSTDEIVIQAGRLAVYRKVLKMFTEAPKDEQQFIENYQESLKEQYSNE